jgi:hypothetical protein
LLENNMHWIDPTSLPALSGEVERFIINPHGDLDGVVLVGGGLVHFPHHLSEAVAAAIRPGDPITVHGVRLRGVDMVAAVSLTAKSGEVILEGLETKHGRVIEVSEIAAAGSKLKSVKTPERDKDGKHKKEGSLGTLPR